MPLNGLVPLHPPLWRHGNAVKRRGNAVMLCGCNRAFEIEGTLSLTADAVDVVTVVVLQDGVPVPGGTFSATAAAAADEVLIPVRTVVKNECKCGSSIAFRLEGVAAVLTSESLEVETWGC